MKISQNVYFDDGNMFKMPSFDYFKNVPIFLENGNFFLNVT